MRTLLVLSLFLANALSAVKKEPIYLPDESAFSLLWNCSRKREFNKAKTVKAGQLVNIWTTGNLFQKGREYIVVGKEVPAAQQKKENFCKLTLKSIKTDGKPIIITIKKTGSFSLERKELDAPALKKLEKKLYEKKNKELNNYSPTKPIHVKSSKENSCSASEYRLISKTQDTKKGSISTILEKDTWGFRKRRIHETVNNPEKFTATPSNKINQHVYRLTYSYAPNWKTIIPTMLAMTGTATAAYYRWFKK